MEMCPYSCFQWCGYIRGPWVPLVTIDEFSVRFINITSRTGVAWAHSLLLYLYLFLTQWIMAILSKGCKPDNSESHTSLKLTFTNICSFHLNFVECESFLESNSPDNLALCETNLDDSIDSGNVSVRGYRPLNRKDSITHAWSCSCRRPQINFTMTQKKEIKIKRISLTSFYA